MKEHQDAQLSEKHKEQESTYGMIQFVYIFFKGYASIWLLLLEFHFINQHIIFFQKLLEN